MDFEVDKKFTITLTDIEAKAIAHDLFNYINGYRGGSSGPARELLRWLSTRNEDNPSGEDPLNPHQDKEAW